MGPGEALVLLVCLGAVLLPLVLVLVWAILAYNGLVRTRNHCHEAWSGVDTELKRRYELIPNLVRTVEGYADHEKETLAAVVEARQRAVASTGSPGAQAQDENALVGSLRTLLAVSENYPDLRASENFLELQKELSNTEDRIQAARRFYNGNVRELNNRVQTFPSNAVAGTFGIRAEEFFDIDDAVERTVPEVRLGDG